MSSDNQITDDWTKNWEASIAVKISAVVLWMLVVVSLASIAYQLSRLDSDLLTLQKSEADQIAYRIGKITSQSSHQRSVLEGEFNQLLKKFNFIALTVVIGSNEYKVGDYTQSLEKHETRTVSFFSTEKNFQDNAGYAKALISTYSLPTKEIIKDKRRNLIVLTVIFLTSFSALLTWIINQIVTKPIQCLLKATRDISSGKYETRLSLERYDEFGQLAEFFNSMLDTIETKQDALQLAIQDANLATIAKSEFLANMSHEIRTPLTAIIGFSNTLQDENIDEDMRIKSISSIIRNGELLLCIINDILDLTKIEANKIEVEKKSFSLFKLLHDIESLISVQASDKGLLFDIKHNFPLPKEVISDEIRVKQVLINLCSNAVKFTHNGRVSVRVSYDQKSHKIIFEVVDTGIGLTEQQIEKIFTPFTQADSSITRKFGGTGLGLSISNKLANLLGSPLTVESKSSWGSCFTFTIDSGQIDKETLLTSAPKISQIDNVNKNIVSKNSINGSVLLVEDTVDNQILISYYLKEMGAEVTLADNGQVALDLTQDKEFDLILMDMQMPIMGGVEATKALRLREYKLPIVMLTANAMKQFEDECLEAGCNDFLAKPINMDLLQEVIQKYLTSKNTAISSGNYQKTNNEHFEDKQNFRSTLDLQNPKVNKLVNDFIVNLNDYILDLEIALKNKDIISLSDITHSLKGASGSFGFSSLMELAEKVEHLVDKEDLSGVMTEIDNLKKHVNLITSAHS